MNKIISCICCPFGCSLDINKEEQEYLVRGNKCPRGKKYAIEEMNAPKRIITSTTKIAGGVYPMIPVKTDKPVPKGKIFAIMDILTKTEAQTPIKIGDTIVKNVAKTGANIIATKEMQAFTNKE
ncbi:MAG: DUF1667 domain-containing protein [Coxiellaceae bacterium]|jgi:CxxC motif-containing protein|nr:DUF1667 domain-containing protein [Coxiellaceae bacterium]